MTSNVHHRATRTVTARSSRLAAALFNYGNIVAVLVPVPLAILWAGASMFVYAMNRHHPNPKVGHYTQQAAYRFYAIAGAMVAIGTFIPGGAWHWYLVAWAVAALILIPWSLVDLVRIHRDEWVDMEIESEAHDHD